MFGTNLAVLLIATMPIGLFQAESEHAGNPVLQSLKTEGFKVGKAVATFPQPLWNDGDSAEQQKIALRKAAGSGSRMNELLRDSVTAPNLLKLRDLKTDDESIVRVADILFAVHADFDSLDFDRLQRVLDREEAVEAGNMRFESKKVPKEALHLDEFAPNEKKPAENAGFEESFIHIEGRLLDRIGFETTERVTATKSSKSIVVAARTLSKINEKAKYPNLWRKILLTPGGRPNAPGPARRYAGGASVLKISKYQPIENTLIVEVHLVFAEPKEWFDGAPTLRSKIGLAVQDQTRRLRREIAEKKAKK
jgi:hypothetical protein